MTLQDELLPVRKLAINRVQQYYYCKRRKFGVTIVWRIWQIEEIRQTLFTNQLFSIRVPYRIPMDIIT